MTILPSDEPNDSQLGAQRPRLYHVPEYAGTTGDEAIELAAMAGLNLLPWQQWVLRHSLGEGDDGKWAAFEVALVVGRQNGKNAILEARELAELYLVAPMLGPRLIIHSAHQFPTALEHFRRMKRRILDTPELLKRVKGPTRKGMPAGIRDSHGEESIELQDGSRLIFKARTSSGGQGAGFTADLLVWDEAWNLPDSVVGFVLPTLSAKTMETPGVQVWYTSQAVNQQTMPNGLHLARIRERGIAGQESGIFFAEWSVDEAEFAMRPELADDPAALAQANPSLGYLIALEHVRRERAGAMPWYEYLAHRLGIGDWPDTSTDAGWIVKREVWKAAAEHDPENRITERPVLAVDSNPDMSWASIAISGRREDKLFNGAIVEHRPGADWLVARCLELKAEYPRIRVVIHKQGPLGSHVDDFKRAKIRVIEASSAEYSQACIGFVAGVNEGRFRYPFPQRDLDEALASARMKDAETVKWTRKDAEAGDISPLVAVTLAYWGAEQAKGGTRVVSWKDIPED